MRRNALYLRADTSAHRPGAGGLAASRDAAHRSGDSVVTAGQGDHVAVAVAALCSLRCPPDPLALFCSRRPRGTIRTWKIKCAP